MNNFDKLVEELKEVASEYGVELLFTRVQQSRMIRTCHLEMKVVEDAEGNEIDPARDNYIRFAKMFGLEESWYKKPFRDRTGKQMMIIGVDPNRPKNSVKLLDVTRNKEYICKPSWVRNYLA